jgi:hypothetical protein
MKLLLVCAFTAFVFAQDAAWDNSPRAAQLAAQADRLKPLLDQLKPDEWLAKGAPQAYVTQFQDAHRELAGLAAAAELLDKQPQKLTVALDTYFRLQSLEWRIESLIDAVRKYQNPATGDQMLSVLRANSGNRDALRAFITDLAARKEQEFTIVSQDAQACRAELTQIPTAKQRNTKAK